MGLGPFRLCDETVAWPNRIILTGKSSASNGFCVALMSAPDDHDLELLTSSTLIFLVIWNFAMSVALVYWFDVSGLCV